jgi:ferredoxin
MVMADVVIDVTKCHGHCRCALIAPEVFDVDDAGLSFVLIDTIPAELRPSVQEAVLTCPENAISFVGDKTLSNPI